DNAIPATDPRKPEAARRAGALALTLIERGTRPSDILGRWALHNAVAAVAATGGSTNAVLHLLAIALESGIDFDLHEVERICSRTPIIADLKPSGRFTAPDLDAAGGHRLLARRLLDAGLLHDIPTVSGETLAYEAAS